MNGRRMIRDLIHHHAHAHQSHARRIGNGIGQMSPGIETVIVNKSVFEQRRGKSSNAWNKLDTASAHLINHMLTIVNIEMMVEHNYLQSIAN